MIEIFYDFLGYNEIFFLFLNELTNTGALPTVLHNISSIFRIANFGIGYILICIYFYFKIKKGQKQQEYFMPIYYNLVRIGTIYAIFGFTFAALKFSINLPRPYCSLYWYQFSTIADTEAERCLSSFPSAHTGLSLFLAYCLWPYMNKSLKFLSCIVVLAVAASRITLAMHYPADIFYSILVTIFVIRFGNFLHRKLKDKITKPLGGFIFRLLFG